MLDGDLSNNKIHQLSCISTVKLKKNGNFNIITTLSTKMNKKVWWNQWSLQNHE